MREIKPPELVDAVKDFKLFLAGSIEMGKAEDWQTKICKALEQWDVTIFNPRRDDWDSSWEQKITNQQFYEQVNWELDHIDKSTCVVFYFDPKSKSPITLMELGLACEARSNALNHGKPGSIIVCCPEGFWRKGNVDIVCERYGIKQADNLDQLISILKSKIYYQYSGAII
jgi:hypothetical protein